MSLIAKVLRQKRRFTIGWTIGLAAMSLFMMVMYPALRDSGINESIQQLPPALQKISGGLDSFSSVDKYIGGELFSLRMPLMLIIMSVILFVGLTVGDERRGIVQT